VTRANLRAWSQASICLLSAIVGVLFALPLEPTEFSSGRVTGPLLRIHDVSGVLFLLSTALTFFRPRFAAVIGLVAAALALPFYAYFVTPGLFRTIVRGEYSMPMSSFFGTSPAAIGASALLIVAAYVCARRLLRQSFVPS
jgi:hypothetical protein